ncbi:MAG TPA: hypothetical protein VL381_03895 [Rhodocyclaceae bacterium]|nr:hypothetical protein [Rhodocyclaceae bacterium]
MDATNIRPPKKWLTATFIGYFVSIVLFLGVLATSMSAGKSASEAAQIGIPLILLVPIVCVAYLFALGAYVRAQGKAATAWIILTAIGGPFGVFISYFAAQGAGNKIATIIFWAVAGPFVAIAALGLIADWLQ